MTPMLADKDIYYFLAGGLIGIAASIMALAVTSVPPPSRSFCWPGHPVTIEGRPNHCQCTNDPSDPGGTTPWIKEHGKCQRK